MLSQNNNSIVSINGQISGKISARDRGLMYGDGLFETFAFRQNKFELKELHLERLVEGCKRLRIPISLHLIKNELAEFQHKLTSLGVSQAVVKLIITRGIGSRGYGIHDCGEPTRIIMNDLWPIAFESLDKDGVEIRLCETRISRSIDLAGLKHLNRLEQVLARSEWDNPAIVEGLLMDEQENLIEGTYSNLFIVNAKSEIQTPSLQYSGVAGVMRRNIMENIAPKLGLTVSPTLIDRQQLASANEVFLTNSIIGILPVISCLDLRWGVGDVTKSLQWALIEDTND